MDWSWAFARGRGMSCVSAREGGGSGLQASGGCRWRGTRALLVVFGQ